VDLRVLGGVLARHRILVIGGVAAGVVLATLAYFKPVMDGGLPHLEPRKAEVWQATETLFLTQPGFPAGRTEQPVIAVKVGDQETAVARYADPGKFTGLAPLYAKLANSDAVRARAIRAGGPLEGQARAIPTADTSYGAINNLPMITVFSTAPTRQGALSTATRISQAFQSYLVTSQKDAKIPDNKRVVIQVLNKAGEETLLVPRKKTLPIVVLLAILSATVALAFIRENTRHAEAAPAPAAVPDADAEALPAAERAATVEHPRFRPERQRAPGTRLGG
jgi:hypothetical protein